MESKENTIVQQEHKIVRLTNHPPVIVSATRLGELVFFNFENVGISGAGIKKEMQQCINSGSIAMCQSAPFGWAMSETEVSHATLVWIKDTNSSINSSGLGSTHSQSQSQGLLTFRLPIAMPVFQDIMVGLMSDHTHPIRTWFPHAPASSSVN